MRTKRLHPRKKSSKAKKMKLPAVVDKDRKVYYHKNESGVIEVRYEDTGELLALQRNHISILDNPSAYVRAHTPDGKIVYLEKDLEIERFPTIYQKYDGVICDLVCQKIAEGLPITDVCKLPGFPPYGVLMRWRREHSEFNEAYERARRDRVEVFFDKAIAAAEAAETKDEAQVAKVKVDAYKWAAEKSDPDKMAGKQQQSGNGQVMIVIETGIRRYGDEGFKPQIQVKDINNK